CERYFSLAPEGLEALGKVWVERFAVLSRLFRRPSGAASAGIWEGAEMHHVINGSGLETAVRGAMLLLALLVQGAAVGQATSPVDERASGFAVAAVASERSPTGPWAKGRILVAPTAGLTDSDFGSILQGHNGKSLGKLHGTNVHVVQLPTAADGHEAIVAQALARNPHIKFAEVDRIVAPAGTANDPYFSSEWHLSKINAPFAWDAATGAGVIIAILDTGVDGTHPDLAAQMVPGWNFYDNNSNTSDVNGHGTAVAGAAAATTNNAIGVASVAGGAKIMPVRIADPSAYAL